MGEGGLNHFLRGAERMREIKHTVSRTVLGKERSPDDNSYCYHTQVRTGVMV